MRSIFLYKYFISSLKNRNNNNGFTLAELIISGFVSLLVLISGFTLLRMNMQVNKSDEINLKLGGKINNALDKLYSTYGYSYEWDGYQAYYWPGATRNTYISFSYSF